jgi:hypothetical protein
MGPAGDWFCGGLKFSCFSKHCHFDKADLLIAAAVLCAAGFVLFAVRFTDRWCEVWPAAFFARGDDAFGAAVFWAGFFGELGFALVLVIGGFWLFAAWVWFVVPIHWSG